MSLDYDISPDPEPDEAAALVAAIEQAIAEDQTFAPPTRGAWVDDGVHHKPPTAT